MLHDFLFRATDVDVTNELSSAERKELLKTLANLWGGMDGAPKCYIVYAGLNRHDKTGNFFDQKNNLALFANTAELRRGVLTSASHSWRGTDKKTKEVFDESQEWFVNDLKKVLKFSGYFQTDENIKCLASLYYHDIQDPRIYNDFDDLKEAVCKVGFSNIGENLHLPIRQNEFKIEGIPDSLKPGSALTSKEYWKGIISLATQKGSCDNYFGCYVLWE